jgi:hypothetical protein
MNIEEEDLVTAYKKLKRLIYYDNNDLSIRKRLAEFETDPSFRENLSQIGSIINSDEPCQKRLFKKWLEEIDFRVLPKKIEDDVYNNCSLADSEGRFISNVSSSDRYVVSKVNYFFDGPIALHLIAVLWIMKEGYILDKLLGNECHGNRLYSNVGQENDHSPLLYRKYHELYVRWRDLGIRKAQQLLVDEKKNVCILGLDIQEYYYHVVVDYNKITKSIAKYRNQIEHITTPSKLLLCIQAICLKYREKINPCLNLTHQIEFPEAGLPIGLCASQLLANWHLRKFDKKINSLIEPSYYGRYVDDILIVIPTDFDPSKKKDPIGNFINRIFVKSGILEPLNKGSYKIDGYKELFLQQSKCILQFFDATHSIAGLVKFKKKLEENISEFKLLPVDEEENSLEDVAYELLYEGSVNKFRSVKGTIENRYELAKNLAKQIIIHLFTNDPPDKKKSKGLRIFFKGKNAIEYHDLWERVLTFFLIANHNKAENVFCRYLYSVIKRINYQDNATITSLMIKSLKEHLNLCIDITHALSDAVETDDDDIKYAFRHANLIRHHFVRLPLLNYTNYSGSFIAQTMEEKVEIDHDKTAWSPRFVNLDECVMLINSGNIKLNGQKRFQLASEIFTTINNQKVENIDWNYAEIDEVM